MKQTLIIGASGQLGRALTKEFPEAELADHDSLDISNPSVITARDWNKYDLILNTAAYTAVDLAQTPEGRINAWKVNAAGPTYLARIANENNITIVHISTDYVFDGLQTNHTEEEPFTPLSVYGQSKAAGDIVIGVTKQHYIIRTSWVIGEGKNFVLTMKDLAEKGVKPKVVNDQIGRPTFTADLAKGIKHLTSTKAPFGTYNLTNEGKSASWAEIASLVYEIMGRKKSDVLGISTKEYYAEKEGVAPRPLQSTLNLDKIRATGFAPRDWKTALRDYLTNIQT